MVLLAVEFARAIGEGKASKECLLLGCIGVIGP